MKLMPDTAIDGERERLRNAMAGYDDKDIWNLDESAIFTNALSNYSYQRRELG